MCTRTSSNPAAAPHINLKTLAKPHTPLTVTGCFHGMPIRQEGHVIKLENGALYISVKDDRIYACTSGQVELFAGPHTRPIHACLDAGFPVEGVLVLKDFWPCQQEWTPRQEERVQPAGPLHVTVRCKRKSFRAVLDNLSAEGAGLLAEHACEPVLGQPGARAALTFPPGCGLALKTLLARTVYCEPVTGSLLRVGLELLPNRREAATLREYICRRKAEIMEELKWAVHEQTRPRDVVSLYF